MDSPQKKANRFIEVLILLVVIICAAMIIFDIYTNVTSELQGSLFIALTRVL